MHFGVQRPYKVLLDGNFLHACSKNKINVRDRLAAVLNDRDVDCLVPSAVVEELTAIGDPCEDALHLASTFKRAQDRSVQKKKKTGAVAGAGSISAAEGILKLVGTTNRHRYVVCTQDEALRKSLNAIPGVPIIYLNIGVAVLEPPTRASREFNASRELKKMAPRKDERRRLQQQQQQRQSIVASKVREAIAKTRLSMLVREGGDERSDMIEASLAANSVNASASLVDRKKKRKPRGLKQANPLSQKSKKRRSGTETNDGSAKKPKKRRRRRQRRN